jgi:hypothetical protein
MRRRVSSEGPETKRHISSEGRTTKRRVDPGPTRRSSCGSRAREGYLTFFSVFLSVWWTVPPVTAMVITVSSS